MKRNKETVKIKYLKKRLFCFFFRFHIKAMFRNNFHYFCLSGVF